MDDKKFQITLAGSIVGFVIDKVREEGKGPGHAMQALESAVVGMIAVAAEEDSWESIARELAVNVQTRLSKMRAMNQRKLH